MKIDINIVKDYLKQENYELLSDKYVNVHKKMKMKCPEGHIFEMSFNNFKRGQRCPECKKISNRKYTLEEISAVASKNGYILKNDEIKSLKDILILEDSNHNITKMLLMTFENRYIKDKKVKSKFSKGNVKRTQQEAELIVSQRGYKLLSKYKNNKSKVTVQCPEGHIYSVRFDCFHRGQNCKICMSNSMKNDISKVISNLNQRGYKLLSKYKTSNDYITLQCKKGHIFQSTYSRIIDKHCGCPICIESKGEYKISKLLEKYSIKYIRQYKTENCKFHKELPFDFYLTELNTIIEFDGIQHFKIISHFGGYNGFVDRKIRDTIKNKYCEDNNIKLLRIPYTEYDNLENIIKSLLN